MRRTGLNKIVLLSLLTISGLIFLPTLSFGFNVGNTVLIYNYDGQIKLTSYDGKFYQGLYLTGPKKGKTLSKIDPKTLEYMAIIPGGPRDYLLDKTFYNSEMANVTGIIKSYVAIGYAYWQAGNILVLRDKSTGNIEWGIDADRYASSMWNSWDLDYEVGEKVYSVENPSYAIEILAFRNDRDHKAPFGMVYKYLDGPKAGAISKTVYPDFASSTRIEGENPKPCIKGSRELCLGLQGKLLIFGYPNLRAKIVGFSVSKVSSLSFKILESPYNNLPAPLVGDVYSCYLDGLDCRYQWSPDKP